MGTWGPNNFENDGAMDFAGYLIDQWAKSITDMLADIDPVGLDDGGEEELMPMVHLIYLTAKETGACPPEPDTILSWKNDYLKIYDDEIDGLDPDPEFKVERRRVIESTFDDLLNLARDFHQ